MLVKDLFNVLDLSEVQRICILPKTQRSFRYKTK